MVAVACMAVGLFVLDRIFGVIADGAFELEIRLVPPENREIVRVSVELLSELENFESLRANPEKHGIIWKDVGWVKGQPFHVHVWWSRHESGIGRELKYAQYSCMILRVEFERGPPEYIIVDIPDGRVKRTIDVTVPDRSS